MKRFVLFYSIVVLDVSLSNSSLPYEGFVQITTTTGTKSVCEKSLKDEAPKHTVCRHLGYTRAESFVNISAPSNNEDLLFSRTINCDSKEKNLAQCSITGSDGSCSKISYVKCKLKNVKTARTKLV